MQSLLINLINAHKSKKAVLFLEHCNRNQIALLQILWAEGVINGYTYVGHSSSNQIKVFLRYVSKNPSLIYFKSFFNAKKPLFLSKNQIKTLKFRSSFAIFNTSLGLRSSTFCLKKGLGGRLLFLVY